MRRRTALLACLAATPAAVALRAGAAVPGECPSLAEAGHCALPGLHAEAAEALDAFRRTSPWAEAPARLERANCPSCGGALHGKWKPQDPAKPGDAPKA